jgi:hypothetical protein
VSVQDRCTVCAKHTIGLEILFRCTRWYSYMMRLKWRLVLVHLETMLVSVQDSCMVCAERTTGSEIILTHLMKLLGVMGHVEPHFDPFGDSGNLDTR